MWEWRLEQESAFQVLKSRLVERPILAIYNREADTEVHTDAIKDGIGGILLQKSEIDGSFRPVAILAGGQPLSKSIITRMN